VLAVEDVIYRGIQIPRRFWKIAAWTSMDDAAQPILRAAGFILDQGPTLDGIDLSLRAESVPPLGPFLTYQAPVFDIASITGLALDVLIDADRFAPVPAVSAVPTGRTGERWKWIEREAQIAL
jgi:endonuclease G